MTHAFREQDTPNADPARTPDNTHIGAQNVGEALAKFNARMPDKVRSNAVLAIEYLIGASPEDLHGKSRAEQDAYFGDALKWLHAKHGAENVVYAGIHRDETTPHMYAYVVPIDDRGKLNCRAFLGGSKALNQMQSDFAQDVGQAHGLQRGIEGSKAKHTTIKQYYTRANTAFEPLPQVTTPQPTLREEPKKPGLLAGKDEKEAWKIDHLSWEKEKAEAYKQADKRKAELKAQTSAALVVARKHEVKAKEADALKAKVKELKASNAHYVAKAGQLESKLTELHQVVQLFTPEEIKAAKDRKARQDAKDRAEKAKETEIKRRVDFLPKLLQLSGAAYTFGKNAIEALKKAAGDASKTDWKAAEAKTARESIGNHGQDPLKVIEALLSHSPGRADPATHSELKIAVIRAAPGLQEQYRQEQQQEQEPERKNRQRMR